MAFEWKSDNFKFVGKSFDFAYADNLNKLMPILGVEKTNSADFELTGTEGYGEMQAYDGGNLNMVSAKRGFKNIVSTGEFSASVGLGKKECRVDRFGATRRVGQKLGYAAAYTVYAHTLRMFGGAFDPTKLGGDGKPWAATDHPVASKHSDGRKYVADPDSGTFSNLITQQLSVSAITKAQTMASRFVTPDGAAFLCDFDTLLVSPELEPEAKKICGENAKLRPMLNPEDDTNAANPLYTMNYIVIGGGKDGFSAKQWAVCDKRLMKEMVKLIYGEKPSVYESELDNPLRQMFTAYADFGLGWGDARPIIFSNPG